MSPDTTDTAIKPILANHSAHISKETKAWLATQPEHRFALVFTPKHGSWLNLVEGFFSKMARSVLRRIRVASKDELKARIFAYCDDLNRNPPSIPGPTKSMRPSDMHRFMESM